MSHYEDFIDPIPVERIRKWIILNPKTCNCGHNIMPSHMEAYPHSGGLPIKDYKLRQWIYFKCPVCQYKYALWKLLTAEDRDYLKGKI